LISPFARPEIPITATAAQAGSSSTRSHSGIAWASATRAMRLSPSIRRTSL
jgi:hypothetical protein